MPDQSGLSRVVPGFYECVTGWAAEQFELRGSATKSCPRLGIFQSHGTGSVQLSKRGLQQAVRFWPKAVIRAKGVGRGSMSAIHP